MSKKSPKIAALIAHRQGAAWPAQYLGYFDCFNQGLFFEAHEVLEELWLAGGRTAPNYAFYKGLIQLAGAFVHLQKNRLRPAVALFDLAEANLKSYPAVHDACDVAGLRALGGHWRAEILAGEFVLNPWGRRPAPVLAVPGERPDTAVARPSPGR